MTRDEIISMAREAGFVTGTRDLMDGAGSIPTVTAISVYNFLPELERLFALYEEHTASKGTQGGTMLSAAPEGWKEAADHIIDFLQSQYDTEGITENDSGDALIRLSGAIAAVEEVLLAAAPKPEVK